MSVSIKSVRRRYAPLAPSGLGAAVAAGEAKQRSDDQAAAGAARTVSRLVKGAAGGAGSSSSTPSASSPKRPPRRLPRAAVASVASQTKSAAAAVRGQVSQPSSSGSGSSGSSSSAASSGSTYPAPSASSSPAPSAKSSAPAASAPKAETSKPPVQKIVKKARAAKVDPSSFDKATLNRAVARFAATHKWARGQRQSDAVRQAAAYLLSKEHSFYNAPAGKSPRTTRSTDAGRRNRAARAARG